VWHSVVLSSDIPDTDTSVCFRGLACKHESGLVSYSGTPTALWIRSLASTGLRHLVDKYEGCMHHLSSATLRSPHFHYSQTHSQVVDPLDTSTFSCKLTPIFVSMIILHYSKDTYTSINANMRYAPNTDTI